MFKIIFTLALLAAIGYASWPLLIRTFGANIHPAWLTLIMGIGTFMGGMAAITVTRAPAPNTQGFLICTAVGIICGLGTYAYSKLIIMPEVNLSVAVPMTILLITGFAVIGAALFYKETITLKQGIGLFMTGVAIWLLS